MKKFRRSIALILTMMMAFQPAMTAFAENGEEGVFFEKIREGSPTMETIAGEASQEIIEDVTEPEEESVEETGPEDVSADDGADVVTPSDADAPETATPTDAAKEPEAFEESKETDGVLVTVKADAGVFPEGAVLSVKKVVREEELAAIEEAIEKTREDGKNISASYSFDIRILAEGEEVQPDRAAGDVKVSFELAEPLDGNFEAHVYHVTEADNSEEQDDESEEFAGLSLGGAPCEDDATAEEDSATAENKEKNTRLGAEELSVETEAEQETKTVLTVMAECFSYYTVEFTYNGKQYVLNGDSSVKLSEILDEVGLVGTVTDAVPSDESLFTVTKDDEGDWTVTALQAFSSEESLMLVINGKVYVVD